MDTADLRRRKLHSDVKHETTSDSNKKNNETCKATNNTLSFIVNNKFVIALCVRLLACFVTRTFFVPDEYWQSTEVAHRQVFQYGYLTWEWKERIRSYLYPFIFEVYFRLLDALSLDTCILVRYGPHVVQAVLSTLCDVSVYNFTLKVTGRKKEAVYAYLLHLTSWFIFYTSARTLSNTAEMCFSTIGLSYFPYNNNNSNNKSEDDCNKPTKKHLPLALLFGGIACIIRPTCFLIWAPLVLSSLFTGHIYLYKLISVCLALLPVMSILLFGLDYYFYGQLTFVHWNFVKFNILENIGEFYGSHGFHWYLSQGLPVVCLVQLVFVCVGMVLQMDRLDAIAVFYIVVHSFISHKEFRFLLPIYPILMRTAARGFTRIRQFFSRDHATLLWFIVMLVNVPMALYFCLVHQRGTVHVMDFIQQNLMKSSRTKTMMDDSNVLFLMPCHSTPYYSYLHRNVTMRFLTCEPSVAPGYICESDGFYDNPLGWLKTEFNKEYRYVIGFDVLPEVAKNFLDARNYSVTNTFFHTHFPEGNIGGYVHVYTNNHTHHHQPT